MVVKILNFDALFKKKKLCEESLHTYGDLQTLDEFYANTFITCVRNRLFRNLHMQAECTTNAYKL